MSLLKDITASYRAPRTEMHRQTARGITEPHTLMLAFLLGVLLFVSRLPALLNESVDSGQLFFHLFAQNLVSFVFVAPLGLYLIATALYWALRPFGARCGGKIARYTFIWSFVIALPFVLGLGLAAPFNIIMARPIAGGHSLRHLRHPLHPCRLGGVFHQRKPIECVFYSP